MKLREIVNFREDLLFDGAVQVDWFDQDPEQSEFAAQHFVFHGPDYHGVQQSDLGRQVDHKLIDTASFAAEIAAGFATPETRKAFRIAIAGYGTGKSHLALTLAHLLDNPTGASSQKIVTNIADASTRAGARISDAERDRPHLVAVINGMADFDLAGEITRQVVARLNSHGLDAEPVEELRPRFKVAERLLDSEFFGTIEDELAETLPNMDKACILDRLRGRDEAVFAEVSKVLDAHDMSVSNFGRWSAISKSS